MKRSKMLQCPVCLFREKDCTLEIMDNTCPQCPYATDVSPDT
jgi:hypothetical protein